MSKSSITSMESSEEETGQPLLEDQLYLPRVNKTGPLFHRSVSCPVWVILCFVVTSLTLMILSGVIAANVSSWASRNDSDLTTYSAVLGAGSEYMSLRPDNDHYWEVGIGIHDFGDEFPDHTRNGVHSPGAIAMYGINIERHLREITDI
jgi:hypothetical protein